MATGSKSEKKTEKKEYKPRGFKGTVYVITNRCKGCGFCVEYCPKKILKTSLGFNAKGYHFPIVTDKEGCINCKVCEDICPEFAIFSVAREEKKEEKGGGKDKSGGSR